MASLSALETYLHAKILQPKRQVIAIQDIIRANLRASTFSRPEGEKDVQNTLETIFRARELEYLREGPSIRYSLKSFIPDFSFEIYNLALEVKFCNSDQKMKSLIDEINSDIPAYQTRFESILFVIYDLGYINDEHQFRTSIERNENVFIQIQKH
ncbi:hypothetical protein IH574_05420 [Candidatus Bathyarchaeota archaeon]|nr:hypothetical protein [Candidatus Bathyarchaeota archaeon]